MMPPWMARWNKGLTLALVALWILGLIVVLKSALQPLGPAGREMFHRQLLTGAAGLLVLAGGVVVSPRLLESWSRWIYWIALAPLVAVLLFGETAHGARRWISFWGVRFQPSEPVKLVLILALASYLSERRRRWDRWRHWGLALAMTALPAGLVLGQPDLGTALVILGIGLGMTIVAGMPLMLLFLLVSLIITAAAALVARVDLLGVELPVLAGIWIAGAGFLFQRRCDWRWVVLFLVAHVGVAISSQEIFAHLEPYQKARLVAFLDPGHYRETLGYQVLQSIVAIGSGGWARGEFGKGPLKELLYLPRQHTDFVFSVLGEEGGFVWTAVVVLLFLLIVVLGLRTARRARNPYTSAVATGVSLFFFLHTAINIGVTVGLTPVTGLPLPFFSYGGSFLLTCMAAAGLLLGASYREKEY